MTQESMPFSQAAGQALSLPLLSAAATQQHEQHADRVTEKLKAQHFGFFTYGDKTNPGQLLALTYYIYIYNKHRGEWLSHLQILFNETSFSISTLLFKVPFIKIRTTHNLNVHFIPFSLTLGDAHIFMIILCVLKKVFQKCSLALLCVCGWGTYERYIF